MNGSKKWVLAAIAWAGIAFSVFFVNPKVAAFLADQITLAINYVFGFLVPHDSFIATIIGYILKVALNVALPAGEIVCGIALLGWLGLKPKKPSSGAVAA